MPKATGANGGVVIYASYLQGVSGGEYNVEILLTS